MVRASGSETGNTLLLVPAALLIMIAMVGLVIDAAVAYLGQRQLADLAAAAARDAVQALDHDAYYDRGAVEIDHAAAAVRIETLRALQDGDRSLEDVTCVLDSMPSRVTVTCQARARPLIVPVWGLAGDQIRLTAVESARAAER